MLALPAHVDRPFRILCKSRWGLGKVLTNSWIAKCNTDTILRTNIVNTIYLTQVSTEPARYALVDWVLPLQQLLRYGVPLYTLSLFLHFIQNMAQNSFEQYTVLLPYVVDTLRCRYSIQERFLLQKGVKQVLIPRHLVSRAYYSYWVIFPFRECTMRLEASFPWGPEKTLSQEVLTSITSALAWRRIFVYVSPKERNFVYNVSPNAFHHRP